MTQKMKVLVFNFFMNSFHPRTIKSMDAEPTDMEAKLH